MDSARGLPPGGSDDHEPREESREESREGRLQVLLRERFRLGPESETGQLSIRVAGWAKVTWSGMAIISRSVIVESVAAAVQAAPVRDLSVVWLHRAIQVEVAKRIGLDDDFVRSVIVETIDEHTAVVTWQCRAELPAAEMDTLIAAADTIS